MTIRIAMWSGPRNISTAMMRSFGARSDTIVSDEPFYGAYLAETGDPQPMAERIIADMDCDWHSVARSLRGESPDGSPIWYQKHMPHHMEGPIDIRDFPETRHAFLIRDPHRVAASYANKRTSIRPEHLGVTRQREYFEMEAERLGAAPPVVDTTDVLADPAGMLDRLCCALGIGWDPSMLAWERGPHPRDGIWGGHWYDKVNASTGFGAAPDKIPQLDGEYARVADACRADYEALSRHKLKVD